VETSLLIAGYAAAVATASVAWQVYQWREKRRIRLDIQLSLVEAMDGGSREERVRVRTVNRGEVPVRWTAAELEPQDGSSRRFFFGRPPDTPVIPAYDSLDTWATRADLEGAGLVLSDPVVAIVRVATGEEFRSPPQTLA
jgi:hypothetical protein